MIQSTYLFCKQQHGLHQAAAAMLLTMIIYMCDTHTEYDISIKCANVMALVL